MQNSNGRLEPFRHRFNKQTSWLHQRQKTTDCGKRYFNSSRPDLPAPHIPLCSVFLADSLSKQCNVRIITLYQSIKPNWRKLSAGLLRLRSVSRGSLTESLCYFKPCKHYQTQSIKHVYEIKSQLYRFCTVAPKRCCSYLLLLLLYLNQTNKRR